MTATSDDMTAFPRAEDCSGIILAGGQSRRYDGQNKAMLRVDGRRILDRILTVYRQFFDEIILVTNDPKPFLPWDIHLVSDIYPIRSALTGLHAGLFHATYPHAFVTACDTPFLKPGVVFETLSRIDDKHHVIIPRKDGYLEPLCAVYSKKCLPSLDRALINGRLQIKAAIRRDRFRIVGEKALRPHDPRLLSFYNINTPEDLINIQ